MKLKKSAILSDIFGTYNIKIVDDTGSPRNVVDVLEDLYLKINSQEYSRIMKKISETEATEGHIFDEARNRSYQ
jgi:hypothetical protein